jgi:DNA-binding NtrC family response regulator
VAQEAPLRAAARPSVLVIDDDPDVREFLRDFLGGEGFDVTTLADPSFAIERIRKEMFHLIMLDLWMPKISGIDLLSQIRAIDDDIPVIIMTGYPSLETALASIWYSVSAYVYHPFAVAELREMIARIMRKKNLLPRREADLHAAIGRHIHHFRTSRGLTLEQLAHRTNLSISLLAEIERGEPSVSVSSLFAIATVLDVRMTELVAGA